MKTALRHGWLDRRLDFSEPYRSSPKISHRAWFSAEEYKKLYEATRQRAQEPKKKGFHWEAEQLHDFVLFAVNTGLRPEATAFLQWEKKRFPLKIDVPNVTELYVAKISSATRVLARFPLRRLADGRAILRR